MDGDNLEGRQVQVGEAGILQVVEVPFCQGIPVPSISPITEQPSPVLSPTPRRPGIPSPQSAVPWPIVHPAGSAESTA